MTADSIACAAFEGEVRGGKEVIIIRDLQNLGQFIYLNMSEKFTLVIKLIPMIATSI